MSVLAIIVAAGKGRRLGGDIPKQFQLVHGKPILYYTLKKFEVCPVVTDVIVVASVDWASYIATDIVDRFGLKKVSKVVNGGEKRQDSVYEGLKAAANLHEIVAVHDAVRPFVSSEQIEKCVHAAAKYGAAILAVPSRDTIKTGENGFVIGTPDRRSVWSVQTPQVFKYEILKAAFEQAQKDSFYSTDDSAIVERFKQPVKIIMGAPDNIKITVPVDMKIAELLLQEEKCE